MSNYKIINDNIYISLKNIANDTSQLYEDIEMWLNEDFTFLNFWEKIFNNNEFNYPIDEPIEIEDWIKSDSKSIIRQEDGDYIHAHVLLGFSITDPLVKLNLINNIYKLPKEILEDFLSATYALNKQ